MVLLISNSMKNIFKKVVIVIVIVIVGVGWYLGAYTPLKKSKKFIEATRSGPSIKTVDDLKFIFNKALDFDSPVAKDEVVGFFVDQMIFILSTKPPKEIGVEIIEYAILRLNQILENPKSPELTKSFLKAASIYEIGWVNYGEEEYFRRAEEYLIEGLKVSPRLPQFLYGLFNLYLGKKDIEKARKVGEEILNYWPSDERIKEIMNTL